MDLSCEEWISSTISGFHRTASVAEEHMNELSTFAVSLESHKDNLVLCNLVCSAQVLVHVSTRGEKQKYD